MVGISPVSFAGTNGDKTRSRGDEGPDFESQFEREEGKERKLRRLRSGGCKIEIHFEDTNIYVWLLEV